MKRFELHPLPLRMWHWINTVLILLLIATGVRLRIPDIGFLFAYGDAVMIHRWAGFATTASFLFWLIYGLMSGSIARNYAFRSRRDLGGMTGQVFYYAIGVFKGWANPHPATPEEKFNPLQKVAYIGVMFVVTPIVAATGLLFSNIFYFRAVIGFIGGIRVLDALHVGVAYLFVIYLMVHIYMATLGTTSFIHIKAMFTGYEENLEPPPHVGLG